MEYMVSMKSFKGIWHNEYFIGEGSARHWANDQWVAGAIQVDLFKRERPGSKTYRLIKSVKRSSQEAKAVREVYLHNLPTSPDFSQIYGSYK